MKNIKIISDFMTKIIRKNILFITTILIINYHMIQRWVHITERNISFNDYLSLSVYTCITISVITMLNIIFYIRNNYDSIKVLCKNEFEYFLGICLSVIRNNFIFCTIPLLYALIYSIMIRSLSFTTIKTTIFILIFEWFLPLLVLSIVLSFIAVIINNLILKIIISSIFLYITSTKMLDGFMNVNNLFIKNILKSLNIFEDQSYAYYSDTVGKVVNTAYIIDKLIPILLALTLIFTAYILLNKLSKKYILAIGFTFILLFISLNYISIDFTTYIDEELNYKKYLNNENLSDIEIKKHAMKIDFKSKSVFKDNITLINKSNKESITISLILDNIFKVSNISSDSKQLDFTRKDDLVIVNLDRALKPNEELTLNITYSGYINILSSWNENRYIATGDDLLMPPGSIAWYPKVNQSNDIMFDITLNSNNTVYSNIPLLSKKNGILKTTYEFKGESSDIALFSGEFEEILTNGLRIIYPADTNVKNSINSKLEFLKEIKYIILEESPEECMDYLAEINKVINSLNNKEIKNIIIAELPMNEFLYKDKDGIDSSIDIYHWISGNTLILDK